MPLPPVLVMVPPPITEPRGTIAPKFLSGAPKCDGLPEAYSAVTSELGCALFDAGSVVTASATDGIHLDAGEHVALGSALADVVEPLVWLE